MNRNGILFGAALLVGLITVTAKSALTSAKKLSFAISNYFKLSNIKLLNSDLSFAFKVTNPGTTPVTFNDVNITGNVIYGTKAITNVNSTQSISLQPGESKLLQVTVQLQHLNIGSAILNVLREGNATKLDLVGTVKYGSFSFPVNQKMDLLKSAGIGSRAIVNGIGSYFETATISTLDDLKKQYFKLAKIYHPDAGGETKAFQDLQKEYEFLIRKVLSGSTLNAEEQNNEIVIDEILRAAIDAIVHLPGLEINLVGKWIWVCGNTYPVKDTLKNNGYVFFKKDNVAYWVFKGVESKSRDGTSMDDIYNAYGKKPIKPTPKGGSYLNGISKSVLRADYKKYKNY